MKHIFFLTSSILPKIPKNFSFGQSCCFFSPRCFETARIGTKIISYSDHFTDQPGNKGTIPFVKGLLSATKASLLTGLQGGNLPLYLTISEGGEGQGIREE